MAFFHGRCFDNQHYQLWRWRFILVNGLPLPFRSCASDNFCFLFSVLYHKSAALLLLICIPILLINKLIDWLIDRWCLSSYHRIVRNRNEVDCVLLRFQPLQASASKPKESFCWALFCHASSIPMTAVTLFGHGEPEERSTSTHFVDSLQWTVDWLIRVRTPFASIDR